jgi:hypothetical protein
MLKVLIGERNYRPLLSGSVIRGQCIKIPYSACFCFEEIARGNQESITK